MGKADLKGTVRLVSPEQAASWIAWMDDLTGLTLVPEYSLAGESTEEAIVPDPVVQ